jgi:hypothetical protein
LSRSHLPLGVPLDVRCSVDVLRPSPHLRLELAYVLTRGTSPVELTAQEVVEHLLLHHELAPAGAALSTAGRYEIEAKVARSPFHGRCTVLVTAVDALEARVVAMSWRELAVGTRVAGQEVEMDFDLAWEVETPPSA